jgi:hypothetical protein
VDSYQLPDAKGYSAMSRYLLGISDEERQVRREQILSTSQKDFRWAASWPGRAAAAAAAAAALALRARSLHSQRPNPPAAPCHYHHRPPAHRSPGRPRREFAEVLEAVRGEAGRVVAVTSADKAKAALEQRPGFFEVTKVL